MEIPLVKGEKVVSEYYFKDYLDHKNKCILTNRRLIVGYKNTVEQYPLSKITGTKTVVKKYTILKWVAAIFGLMALGICYHDDWEPFDEDLTMVGILFLLCITFWIWGSQKGRYLEIMQMGGAKRYNVKYSDPRLDHFINEVNATLI